MTSHTLTFFNPPDRERLLIQEAEANDRRVRAFSSQVTPGIARNAAGIAAQYPTLDRELIAATSLAGVPADNPIIEQIALRSWEADQKLWDVVYSGIKGATRVAGTIAQSFYEELVARPIRTAVGTLQGASLSEAYGEAGSSVGVRAVGQLAQGNRVNLGSGFLPGNDVADPDDPNVQGLVAQGVDEGTAIRQVQAQYGAPIWDQYIADSERIKFRGQPVSPGRLAAGVFALEPGSLPYNVFSGTIDAISQVVLDPTSRVLVGFKIPKFIGAGLGGKVVPGISGVRKNMKVLAGISPDGSVRNSVFKPHLNRWIDDREGQLLLDALWEHRGDQIALARIFSRAGKAEPPSTLINALRQPGLRRKDFSAILRGETQIVTPHPFAGAVGGGGPGDTILRRQGQLTGPTTTGVGLEDVLPALGRTPVVTSLAGRAGLIGRGSRPGAGKGQSLGGKLGGVVGSAFEGVTGGRVTPELGRVLGFKATVGQSIDGTRLGRLFATMPGRQIDFKNLDEGARTLDDWMQEAKFTYDERNGILAKWHGLNDADLPSADFYELVFRDVQEVFTRNIVRELVPPSVFAQGDEAVKAWKVGGGAGARSAKDTQLVKMLDTGISKWFDDLDELRRYATIDAQNMPFPGSRFTTLADGAIIEQPTAMLLSEYLNRGFSLPEARKVRRAVSNISRMVSNDALELKAVPQLFDVYMQKIWKPLVLLRVAFPLRVQGDNQLRMAAAGLDSVFRHPLDWLSWSIADPTMEGTVQKVLKGGARVLNREARGETGIVAREVTDELGIVTETFDAISAGRRAQAAMTHGGSSLLGYNPGLENAGDVVYTLLAKGAQGEAAPAGFVQAWVTEFLQLSSDEVAPRVARNKDDAIEWFVNTAEGRKVRNALADTKQKQILVDDAVAQAEGYRSANDAAETYIEGVWARIHEKAGGKVTAERLPDGRSVYSIAPGGDGNTDLINAIGAGKLRIGGDDIDLLTVGGARFTRLTDGFFSEYYDEWAPDVVKIHDTAKSPQGVLATSADNIVSRLFEALASKPENVLSRSPAFRQFYWGRVEELMPFMDEATRAQTLRAARAANLDRTTLGRMAKANLESIAERTISGIDDVENIAMSFALDNTRVLLYDLHKRSNFMDIARNLFPFGEAWVEILTRWSKLAYDHPETLRRFQQVVEGGRRSGFVTTDEVSGQEVFNYPGGGLLANWMLSGAGRTGPIAGAVAGGTALGAVGGIPGAVVGGFGGAAAGAFAAGAIAGDQGDVGLEIQGQVQGINLVAASYLPGLGPLVQMPLAKLFGSNWVMSRPQFNWVKEQIFPFGDPQLNSIDDIAKMTLPAWGKKILIPLSTGDPDFARLHAHSTVDVMRALLQTESYSKDTPEATRRLMTDAADIATNLSIIRGFLQFALPTGPNVRYYAAAKGDNPETNGKFYLFQTLASEYRQMLEDSDFDDVAAFDTFQQRFGLDPVDFITSKTTAPFRRGVTSEAVNFELTNGDTFDRFPLTAYFGGPDDPLDEFDIRAWARQLDEGTRVPYNEAQWVSARNNTIGRAAFAEAQRKVQAARAQRGEDDLEAYDPAERAYLSDMKKWLHGQYPGYDVPNVGTPTKGSRDQKITELIAWTTDPVLSQTSAGRGLELYLDARQEVIERMISLGYSPTAFQSGKLDGQGRAMRRFLRQTAEWIINQPQYRDFGPLWQSILAGELEDDIDPAARLAA